MALGYFMCFFFSEWNAGRKAAKLEVYLGQQIKSPPQGERGFQ